MSNEKMQEDFEECVRKEFDQAGICEADLRRDEQGQYIEDVHVAAWWAWQESAKNSKETMASFLVNQLSLSRGRPVEWSEAVIITAVLTGMDETEKQRLLDMDGF